jgi:hypothetical protein
MGSGKGALEYWVAVVKPGRVMFEIAGVPEETAREALRLAMHKLPCKCKIASKADLDELVTTTANVEARNASKVEVGTTQSLWMSAHDASKITYKGTPVILQSIQEGMSKIKQDN